MNHREMFDIWKRRREKIGPSTDFPERVMAHIRECQPPRRVSAATFASRVGQMAARPWMRAAVVVLGALFGLARIAVTLDLILRV